ncbi:hypothetical protein NDU88_006325 [Pleurodeles waltl]|uniref:Uncharacterized protein n=1 Tax=Pleurodeles waltl TaxID=8319 RepID=A0AAV7MH62_PLEWA|nr:hypothetical protein NDU88_006325 [Pleurodeles waltl]
MHLLTDMSVCTCDGEQNCSLSAERERRYRNHLPRPRAAETVPRNLLPAGALRKRRLHLGADALPPDSWLSEHIQV